MGRRTWFSVLVAFSLVALACGKSTHSYDYDGYWSGPIGQTGEISFTVDQSEVLNLLAMFPQNQCMGGGLGQGSQKIPAGPPFRMADSSSSVVVTGQFITNETASGELQIYSSSCDPPTTTWSWTATKQ